MRKTRKNRKTGTRRRHRGGFMSPEEYKTWRKQVYENLNTYLANNTKFTNTQTYTQNDEEYSTFKYSILQPGQIFAFRSKHFMYSLSYDPTKYTWVDYTAGIGKQSFLTAPPAEATDETSHQLQIVHKKMADYFGQYLNFIRILKPIKIIHFPVNYETNTLGPTSFTSNKEGIVKYLCVDKQSKRCADGYTLDFLWRVATERTGFLKGINLQGFREMAIRMNDPSKVELIGSVEAPPGLSYKEAYQKMQFEQSVKKVRMQLQIERQQELSALDSTCRRKQYEIHEKYSDLDIRAQQGENILEEEYLPGTA
jgi:hypothetical protein